MATHSSVLAWRIPWTEEPGGLHSMVSPPWEVTQPAERARMWTEPSACSCLCPQSLTTLPAPTLAIALKVSKPASESRL